MQNNGMNLISTDFGTLSTGESARLYTLSNTMGMTVRITDYGGAIVSLLVPDRNGVLGDVVLGFDSAATYEVANGYLGAVVGRVAGRIPHGVLEVDGYRYDNLVLNDGGIHHLHGGQHGFSHVLWQGTTIADDHCVSLTLTHHSFDGEDGYPGGVDATVTYTLTDNNTLSIRYAATVDRPCPLDLTNHTYFNLSGRADTDILSHELWVDADRYLVSDHECILTGALCSVEGTPFDFRVTKPIGRDIQADHPCLINAGGYDHGLVFSDATRSDSMPCRVRAYDPISGRMMEVYTDQPTMQFYTANFLNDPNFPLRGCIPQRIRLGFCLETQNFLGGIHYPDGRGFANCTVRPGELYEQTTVLRFSAH